MTDQHVTYDSIAVGDEITPFDIFETQETIDNTRMPEITARPPRPNIHTDPEFAKRGLFAGTVNGGVITMAYVTTCSNIGFPLPVSTKAAGWSSRRSSRFGRATRWYSPAS